MPHTNTGHGVAVPAAEHPIASTDRYLSMHDASRLGRHALHHAGHDHPEDVTVDTFPELPSRTQSLAAKRTLKHRFGVNFIPAVALLMTTGIVLTIFGVTHYESLNTSRQERNQAAKRPTISSAPDGTANRLSPAKQTSQTKTANQQKQVVPTQKAPTSTVTQRPVSNVTAPVNSSYSGTLPSTVSPYVTGNFTYYYAGGRQYVSAAGMSATLSQNQPVVNQSVGTQNHSLMELAAQSADGRQIVEVGWIVDQILNGDSLPHLFVYHWVSGQTSCYNGCGFVRTSGTIAPGSAVAPGSSANYGINYSGGNWNITYNGATIGYYPGSLWNGTYTQIGYAQVFGEVEITNSSTTKCIQMGNGLGGADPGSASISNYTLLGSTTVPALSPFATSGSTFGYGYAGPTGLHLGGPGLC
jgi:hypothetical protein